MYRWTARGSECSSWTWRYDLDIGSGIELHVLKPNPTFMVAFRNIQRYNDQCYHGVGSTVYNSEQYRITICCKVNTRAGHDPSLPISEWVNVELTSPNTLLHNRSPGHDTFGTASRIRKPSSTTTNRCLAPTYRNSRRLLHSTHNPLLLFPRPTHES